MKRNEKVKVAVAACIFMLALCPAGIARTIYVANDGPADFTTIQAAIDDANNGDTVIIQPGTYTGPGNRDISIKSKVITVQSVDPNDPDIVAATVIDCEGTESDNHLGFISPAADKPGTVLAGLTIIHGYAINGGGIYCYDYASPDDPQLPPHQQPCHARRWALHWPWNPHRPELHDPQQFCVQPTYRGEGGGIYCGGWASVTISGCTIAAIPPPAPARIAEQVAASTSPTTTPGPSLYACGERRLIRPGGSPAMSLLPSPLPIDRTLEHRFTSPADQRSTFGQLQ